MSQATNKLTSRSLPNNISSTYAYDGLDRLTRRRHVGVRRRLRGAVFVA